MRPYDFDRVPWALRRTAHGDARHVPQALGDLTSPDEEISNRAYERLDNVVVLQRSLYDAAYDVVPYLVQMLREKSPFGRHWIYDLLFEIGNGDAPDEETIENETGQKLPLRVACREAVRQGLDVYRADLSHPDPIIRRDAADLIESLDLENQ